MALPIWAHARGKLYDTVVMQDGRRPGSGFTSRCRRASRTIAARCRAEEINVDAITCPTRFTSAKGKLDSSTNSYYPPRNDLTMFGERRLRRGRRRLSRVHGQRDELRGAQRSRCGRGGDAALRRAVHGHLDDPGDASRRRLRAARRGEQGVRQQRRRTPTRRTRIRSSRATASRATSASRRWSIACRFTSTCAAGAAAAADHVADRRLQRLDRRGRRDHPARRDDLAPPIPDRAKARLLEHHDRRRHGPGARRSAALRIDDAARRRRRRPARCPRSRPPRTGSPTRRPSSPSRTRRSDGRRRRELRDPLPRGRHHDRSGVRGGDPRAPGHARRARLDRDADHHRAQARDRLRGRGARGRTPAGRPRCSRRSAFATPATPFKQIEGCFVATAAWGSALASQVEALRRARDHARSGNAMAAVAVDLYYRSGPPAAARPAPQRHRPRGGPNVTFSGRRHGGGPFLVFSL